MDPSSIKIEEKSVEKSWNEKCLICSKSCDDSYLQLALASLKLVLIQKNQNASDECLTSHLLSLFILRKLLNISEKECIQLMTKVDGVNPGDWFRVCSECLLLVKEVMALYEQISVLKRKINEWRKLAWDKLKEDLKSESEFDQGTDLLISSTRSIIRFYFKNEIKSSHATEDDEDAFKDENLSDNDDDNLSTDPLYIPEDYVDEPVTADSSIFAEKNPLASNSEDVVSTSKITRKRRQKNQKRTQTTTTSKNSYKCTLCPEIYFNKKHFRTHFYREHQKGKISDKLRTTRRNQKIEKASALTGGLECSICHSWHHSKHGLYLHLISHKKFKHSCEVCKFPGISKRAIQLHITKAHPELKKGSDLDSDYFRCERCDYVGKTYMHKYLHYKKHSLVDNLITRNNDTFTCTVCNKGFPKFIEIYYHVKSHPEHIKSADCFRCDKCDFVGCNNPNVKSTHLKKHNLVDNFITTNSKCDYICNFCKKSFLNFKEAYSHVKSHPECSNSEDFFRCDKCDYVSSGIRLRHIRKHKLVDKIVTKKSEKDYTCNICDKSFLAFNTIYFHAKSIHGLKKVGEKLKRYECPQCKLSYVSKTGLNEHIKHVHVGVRNYCCDKCGSSFKKNNDLKNHTLIYHSEKREPEVCDICGKSAANKLALRTHKHRYHSEKVSKKYSSFRKCAHCGFSAHITEMLKHVESVHENLHIHQCSQCPKKYMTVAGLLSHQKQKHPSN